MKYNFLRHFSQKAIDYALSLDYQLVEINGAFDSSTVVPRCDGYCPVGAMILMDFGGVERSKAPESMSAMNFLSRECGVKFDEDGDDYWSMKNFMWLFDNSREFDWKSALKGEKSSV